MTPEPDGTNTDRELLLTPRQLEPSGAHDDREDEHSACVRGLTPHGQLRYLDDYAFYGEENDQDEGALRKRSGESAFIYFPANRSHALHQEAVAQGSNGFVLDSNLESWFVFTILFIAW